MIKQSAISGVVSAIVAIAIVLIYGGNVNFAGVTHLSGLSIGDDGLAITDGGAVSIGTGLFTIGTSGTLATTTVGGFKTNSVTKDLTTSTTTVCAIQSPSATSTLVGGGIRMTTSSTTASTVTIAKATTAFATTTLINSASVSANAQATVLAASTTVSSLEQTNRIFAPNTWLVFGMAGGTGTFSPVGSCSASFDQI